VASARKSESIRVVVTRTNQKEMFKNCLINNTKHLTLFNATLENNYKSIPAVGVRLEEGAVGGWK